MQIIFSPYALKETDERLFPASKNRSKRIRKKLIKRFGGEFRKQPCMWRLDDRIIAHPSFRAEIERATKPATQMPGYTQYTGYRP